MDVTFQNPAFLWFLLLIPLVVLVHFYSLHYARQKAMRFANFEALEKIVQTTHVIPKNYLLLAMRVLTLIGFILAASGITLHYDVTASAFDYMVAVDASNSMLAQDLTPSRMGAATGALASWLSAMPQGSKAGVVQFSSQATVLAPLAPDLPSAARAVKSIVPDKSGGTAICEALKASTNQFAADDADRAIILISDGRNNAGCLLQDGVEYAKVNRVTVYVIGVGTKAGGAIQGVSDVLFVMDDTELRNVAQQTGGEYFKAENNAQLSDAFGKLLNPTQRRQSLALALPVMLVTFLFVFVDWGLSITRYRAIP